LEGDKVLQQFMLPPQNWQQGDLGLFSVFLGDTGSKGEHILVDGAVTPADFSLKFTARATKWRYFLINSGNIDYTDFQLLDADSQNPVSPPPTTGTKQLPDGSSAIVLTTSATIPLQQRPGQRYLLSMATAGSPPTSIPLPSSVANSISRNDAPLPDGSPDPTFYSDMYVYL
jgi:hypothetical protein